MYRSVTFFICLLLFSNQSVAGEKVLIATNSYTPYISCKGEGFILDVIRYSFRETGVKAEFEFYPWKRCVRYVKKGKAFATTPFIQTEERKKLFDFSKPITRTYNVFFYNREVFPRGFEFKTIEDLKSYNIGGTLGYWYMDEFGKYGISVLNLSERKNFKLLIKKRVDLIIIDELAGISILKNNYPEERIKVELSRKPYLVNTYHLMISKKYPRSAYFREKFNKGLGKIKKSNVYSTLLKKYNIPERFAVF